MILRMILKALFGIHGQVGTGLELIFSLLQTFLDNYRTWAAVWTLRDHTEEFQFS